MTVRWGAPKVRMRPKPSAKISRHQGSRHIEGVEVERCNDAFVEGRRRVTAQGRKVEERHKNQCEPKDERVNVGDILQH